MSSDFNFTVALYPISTHSAPSPLGFANLFTALLLLVQCVPTKIKYRQKLSHDSTPMYVSGTVFTNIVQAPVKSENNTLLFR